MIPWNKGLNKQRDLEWEMREHRKADAASRLDPVTSLEAAGLHYMGAEAAAPKPAKTWDVRIGAYKGSKYGPTLLFSFPGDIMNKLPAKIKIERLDEENWRFSPGAGPKFTPYYGNRVKLNHYEPKAGLFGSSPGKAIEGDDDVLVYCPLATRGESSKKSFWTRPALVKIAPPSAPMPTRTLSLEAGMREVIREIRDIEAACPYRLTRLDNGRIVWRAPVIE